MSASSLRCLLDGVCRLQDRVISFSSWSFFRGTMNIWGTRERSPAGDIERLATGCHSNLEQSWLWVGFHKPDTIDNTASWGYIHNGVDCLNALWDAWSQLQSPTTRWQQYAPLRQSKMSLHAHTHTPKLRTMSLWHGSQLNASKMSLDWDMAQQIKGLTTQARGPELESYNPGKK